MATTDIRILAFAGSLRATSFNRGLIRAAAELAVDGVAIDSFDLGDVPLYNEDLNSDGFPAPVVEFQQAIRDADAVLIATPEYNGSISGVLKNAVDWASRPFGRSSFIDKPIAIMGASAGSGGTANAQKDLRTLLTGQASYVLPRPRVAVGRAGEKFGVDGTLTDDTTRQQVAELVSALVSWQRMLAERPA